MVELSEKERPTENYCNEAHLKQNEKYTVLTLNQKKQILDLRNTVTKKRFNG